MLPGGCLLKNKCDTITGEGTVEIINVPYTKAPIELLLEADPSIEKIKAYLPRSKCFVAMHQGIPVGAYVVQLISPAVYELMSIAVSPEYQRKGIGSKLLKHAVTTVHEMGARRLEVREVVRLVEQDDVVMAELTGTQSYGDLPQRAVGELSNYSVIPGQESVRKGEAGRSAWLHRFPMGLPAQAYLTATGWSTSELETTTLPCSITAVAQTKFCSCPAMQNPCNGPLSLLFNPAPT